MMHTRSITMTTTDLIFNYFTIGELNQVKISREIIRCQFFKTCPGDKADIKHQEVF